MAVKKLFTRNFAICTAICFFYTVMFFMFFTGMTAYSKDILGAGNTESGFIASVFIIGDLFARLIVGKRLNGMRKKRLVTVSLLACTLMCGLYFADHNVITICVLRFFHGFAYGAMSSAINTIVAEILPPERRGAGMGYFMLSLSIGSAIGPFLCMYLQQNATYSSIFAVGLASSAVAFVISLFLKSNDMPAASNTNTRRTKGGYIERSAIGMSSVAFLFFFAYSGVLSFMSLYGEDIGLSDYATYFFVFISIGTIIARLFMGRIYDNKGENMALIPVYILYLIGMYIMSTTESGPSLLMAGVMMGFNIAMITSVGQAVVVRRAGRGRYGTAVTTFNIFIDIAYGIGPAVNGALIGVLGYRGNFLFMTVLAVLSLVLYLAVHGIPVSRHPDLRDPEIKDR